MDFQGGPSALPEKLPNNKLKLIVQSAKPTMQNVECEMQNEGVAYGD